MRPTEQISHQRPSAASASFSLLTHLSKLGSVVAPTCKPNDPTDVADSASLVADVGQACLEPPSLHSSSNLSRVVTPSSAMLTEIKESSTFAAPSLSTSASIEIPDPGSLVSLSLSTTAQVAESGESPTSVPRYSPTCRTPIQMRAALAALAPSSPSSSVAQCVDPAHMVRPLSLNPVDRSCSPGALNMSTTSLPKVVGLDDKPLTPRFAAALPCPEPPERVCVLEAKHLTTSSDVPLVAIAVSENTINRMKLCHVPPSAVCMSTIHTHTQVDSSVSSTDASSTRSMETSNTKNYLKYGGNPLRASQTPSPVGFVNLGTEHHDVLAIDSRARSAPPSIVAVADRSYESANAKPTSESALKAPHVDIPSIMKADTFLPQPASTSATRSDDFGMNVDRIAGSDDVARDSAFDKASTLSAEDLLAFPEIMNESQVVIPKGPTAVLMHTAVFDELAVVANMSQPSRLIVGGDCGSNDNLDEDQETILIPFDEVTFEAFPKFLSMYTCWKLQVFLVWCVCESQIRSSRAKYQLKVSVKGIYDCGAFAIECALMFAFVSVMGECCGRSIAIGIYLFIRHTAHRYICAHRGTVLVKKTKIINKV